MYLRRRFSKHMIIAKRREKRRYSRTQLKIGVGIKGLILMRTIYASVLIHNDEVNMDK